MSRNNEISCLMFVKEKINSPISGLKDSVRIKLKRLLDAANPNSNGSLFPDFIFDGGLIEHFMVSASKETKKGSEYKIYEFKGNKETNEFFDEKVKEFSLNKHVPGTFQSQSIEHTFNKSEYLNFIESFKKNFDHHFESLIKNAMSDGVVIFLLEQQDGRMGIYRNNKFYKFYSLSKDKTILHYLKSKYPLVNYVIFNSADSVEVLDLSNIESFLEHSEENDDIRGGRKVDSTIKIYLDL